jgi:predicted short-subunit dehydrogenase-like oxidoreductase (DUF2520 family)
VPDRAIPEVGAALADAQGCVFHTSGALPGDALRDGRPRSAGPRRAGSLHPLQSFPSGAGPEDLLDRARGTSWFHEGDGRTAARALVSRWGGSFNGLGRGGKALYHAGAAIVSNHTVALFADATRLFALAGVPPESSRPALARLLAGTAENLARLGVPDALTGPVARGDTATIARHLAALAEHAPEVLDAYRAVLARCIEVAVAKGSLDATAADALRRLR